AGAEAADGPDVAGSTQAHEPHDRGSRPRVGCDRPCDAGVAQDACDASAAFGQGPGADLPGHQPGPASRAWDLDAPADRQTGRGGTDEPRQRTDVGQAPRAWWTGASARRALHGHALGGALGPDASGALPAATRA